MKSLLLKVLEAILNKNSIDESIVKGHISKKVYVNISKDDLLNSSEEHPIKYEDIIIYFMYAKKKEFVKTDLFDTLYNMLIKILKNYKNPKFRKIEIFIKMQSHFHDISFETEDNDDIAVFQYSEYNDVWRYYDMVNDTMQNDYDEGLKYIYDM